MKIFLSSLFLLSVITLVILLYRRQIKNPAFILRLIAILILTMAIINIRPLLTFKSRGSQEIIVLIDNSKSIGLGGKFAQMKQAMVNLAQLTDRKYVFSEDLQPVKKGDTISPDGRLTNITQALEKVRLLRPAGLIIISDGRHNYGVSPEEIAQQIEFPIYSVGLGTVLTRDAEIIWLETPAYTFFGSQAKIKIRIKAVGYENTPGEINIYYQNKKIATRMIKLDGLMMSDFEFEILPKDIGRNSYEAILKAEGADDNLLNNRRQFEIDVLKDKTNLLYFATSLSKNASFLIEALKEEDYIRPTYIAEITTGRYYHIDQDGINETNLPIVNHFDVIILDNVRANTFSEAQLLNFVENGGAILMLGGDNLADWFNFFKTTLSIYLDSKILREPVQPKIIKDFSILQMDRDYPPFSAANSVRLGSDKITILAETKEKYPILGYGKYQQGRIFFIFGYPLWQWNSRLTAMNQENKAAALVVEIVRFLTPLGARSRIRLKTDKRIYNLNEMVELTAQTYNNQLILNGGYEVMARIEGADQKIEIPMVENEPGHYRANYSSIAPGNYEMYAYSIMDDVNKESNRVEFSVTELALEQLDAGLNVDLLQTLATMTGGQYVTVDSLPNFRPQSKPVERIKRLTLDFSQPVFLIIFLLLLTFEWILRKRRGEI